DGEGRTRQETYRNDKLRSVYLFDPVAEMTYTLIPGTKIAISTPRIDMPQIHMPRVRIETERKDGKTSTKEITTKNERIVVRTIDGDGQPGTREEVRVQVYRAG